MTEEKRAALLRIIADSASRPEEIEEAKLQLEESANQTQSHQDKLILRYLNHGLEQDNLALLTVERRDELLDFAFALSGWLFGLPATDTERSISMLIALHGRTRNSMIKLACHDAINNWTKVASYQNLDNAIRRATRFLE